MARAFEILHRIMEFWRQLLLYVVSAALTATAHAQAERQTVPSLPICGAQPTNANSAKTVTVQYFGTASLMIADGATSIMTDGFFSRPGKLNVLFTRLSPDGERIDAVLNQLHLTKVDALFVAHSHFDHALDSAAVAARTGAVVLGSASTREIAVASDRNSPPLLPDSKVRVIRVGDVFSCGAFRVTVFSAPHSPRALFLGEVQAPFKFPAWASAFKEGGSFGFIVEHPTVRILVVPSANEEVQLPAGTAVDVVFLSIGDLGREEARVMESYWQKAVIETRAKKVIPIHWDDFTVRLEKPLEPFPRPFENIEKARAFLNEQARRDHIEIIEMDAFDTLTFDSHISTQRDTEVMGRGRIDRPSE